MRIEDVLYIQDKRIYLAGKSNDYDITSYAIELMMKWYIETGYHITKSITAEEKDHALM